MYPWITDYHDELIWEVMEEDVGRATQLLEDAYVRLNKELEFLTVPVKGDIMICDNLAEVKCED